MSRSLAKILILPNSGHQSYKKVWIGRHMETQAMICSPSLTISPMVPVNVVCTICSKIKQVPINANAINNVIQPLFSNALRSACVVAMR